MLAVVPAIVRLLHAAGGFCSGGCGKPHSIEFCAHIDWPVCQVASSWKEADDAAARHYNALLNHSADASVNHSIACGEHFNNVCEDEANRCGVAAAFCQDLNYTHKHAMKVKFDEKQCFNLKYAGPQVGLWVLGVSISVIFSITTSIGVNLQKLSLNRNEKSKKPKPPLQQPYWLCGFCLITMGSLLDFVAFGMAPQTLLAPTAALSLIWNIFLAPFFHKETVTKGNVLGTAVIIFGVTSTLIFAGHSTPDYDLDDLLHLYREPTMHAYIVTIVTFLVSMFVVRVLIERSDGAGKRGMFPSGGMVHVMCYGGMAGTFGGQSVLLAKSTMELIKNSIAGGSAFAHYQTFVIAGGTLLCLLLQITSLNDGLRRFDALIIIPVYQAFWIIMSVLGGIMYFEEYTSMTNVQKFLFAMGTVITLCGIGILVRDHSKQQGGEGDIKYTELTHMADWAEDDESDMSADEETLQSRLDDLLGGDEDDDMDMDMDMNGEDDMEAGAFVGNGNGTAALHGEDKTMNVQKADTTGFEIDTDITKSS